MVTKAKSDQSIGAPSRISIGRELFKEHGLLREAVLAGLLSNLTALVLPLFVMTAYDRILPNAAFSSLWALAFGVFIAAVIDIFARINRATLLEHVGRRVDLKLGSRMLNRLLQVPFNHRPRHLGEVSSSFRELESLRGLLSNTTLTVLVDLPFALLFIGIIAFMHPALAMPALVALPTLVLIALLAGRLAANSQSGLTKTSQQQASVLIEGFGQYETIKSMALESQIQDRWEGQAAERSEFQDKARFLAGLPSHFSAAISMLASAGVVVVGAYLVAQQQASMGVLIAAMILTGRAVAPAAGLSNLINGWVQARRAFKSVSDLLSMSPAKDSEAGGHHSRVNGHWQLESVDVVYPDSPKPSLTGVNLRITPGERIGVLGRGGSGKTTLARVLAGIVVPDRGLAKLDQVDLSSWSPTSRAQGIGYLPQQAGFFAGTVRENLLWGKSDVDPADLSRACELTGLDHYLSEWPYGWDQPVGEGGSMLSGSQRAIIALTRLVLQDPAWVVLDEPTAHLDAKQEQALLDRLAPWLSQRGVFLVTHRSSLLQWVDRLLIVEDCKIVADGPKADVLAMLQAKRAAA